ncbi:hypothetical protein EV363DRAFT_1178978 [Boletus edulis]|uniref:Uncharacterized protein n=1 Tax=Boletus edulis BED1 TaxID=1328754 RepID=A0AAD4BCF6_BOLED|nr:hypothetical protein EV363DRAFT_1178978 [Boletus edulis]KAF8417540.1 hypothetical protein L210DRAFT_720480 [Boletus edulis BED1]
MPSRILALFSFGIVAIVARGLYVPLPCLPYPSTFSFGVIAHCNKRGLNVPNASPLSRSAASDSRIEEDTSSGPQTYSECSSLTDG